MLSAAEGHILLSGKASASPPYPLSLVLLLLVVIIKYRTGMTVPSAPSSVTWRLNYP